MKQALIIVFLLLVLGTVMLLFVHVLLSPAPAVKTDEPSEDYTASSTHATSTVNSEEAPAASSSSSASNSSVQNGDGPFPIMALDGSNTGATVEILRSPEEILLQFKNFKEKYPDGSRLYLAKDIGASKYIDLGPVRLSYGVYLYGMPLDVEQSSYPYVGIYATTSSSLLYYAKLQ